MENQSDREKRIEKRQYHECYCIIFICTRRNTCLFLWKLAAEKSAATCFYCDCPMRNHQLSFASVPALCENVTRIFHSGDRRRQSETMAMFVAVNCVNDRCCRL